MRWAQSRGEWPGSRMTFLEGRAEGDRVDVEGAREDVAGFERPDGGPRKVEAAEGGGRRVVVGFGGILNADGVWVGREGGCMTFGTGCSSVGVAFDVLRTGGGIIALSGFACNRPGAVGFTLRSDIWPASCTFADAVVVVSCSMP